MQKQDVFQLIGLAVDFAKDIALVQCLKRVEDAQRQYLLAEADAKRGKSSALIKAIAMLDIEILKLEETYKRVEESMGEKGREVMNLLVGELESERKKLVKEKRRITHG